MVTDDTARNDYFKLMFQGTCSGHELVQNTPDKAKCKKAPSTIFVSPAFREAGRRPIAVEGPYTPVILRCQKLPLSHPPLPYPHPPDGHSPTSFPGNRTTRRRTDPRGPHGLVGYREANRILFKF